MIGVRRGDVVFTCEAPKVTHAPLNCTATTWRFLFKAEQHKLCIQITTHELMFAQ